MNEDHANQLTDNDSGQNMASEGDLHSTVLRSSNPAFLTLRRMGLKGNITPEEAKKSGTETSVEESEIKSGVLEKTVSIDLTSHVNDITAKSKKKRKTRKKERKSDSKADISSKKKSKVKKPSVLKAEKSKAQDSVSKEGLSPFGEWLNTLPLPVLPQILDGNTEVGREELHRLAILKTQSAHSQHAKKTTADLTSEEADPGATDKTEMQIQDAPLTKSAKARHKKKKKKKKRHYDSGVVLSDEIFSETLADLLATQGHKKQAKHMYEKMRLIYPEKSRFFAAKIEELNIKE